MSFDHRNRDPLARSPLGDFGTTDYSRPRSVGWIAAGFLIIFGLFASVVLLGDQPSTRVVENTALPPAQNMVPPRPTAPTVPIPVD